MYIRIYCNLSLFLDKSNEFLEFVVVVVVVVVGFLWLGNVLTIQPGL
jgi:hypothetical protein